MKGLPVPDWSFPDFEWDDGNVDHIIERHGIYPQEAEQVLYNGAYVRREGDFYYAYGQDDSGRYLCVVCIVRGGLVRVVTARDMNNRERRSYEQRR